MQTNFHTIVRDVEIALAERKSIFQSGPQFRILHRFSSAGTCCKEGEEIASIALIHQRREIQLGLTLALRQLFNYLAETRHLRQSATQIAGGIRFSRYYKEHGKNSGIVSTRKFPRSAIKEYIKRIRRALDAALREARIGISGEKVLCSAATLGNEVHYQLRARIEWKHI